MNLHQCRYSQMEMNNASSSPKINSSSTRSKYSYQENIIISGEI